MKKSSKLLVIVFVEVVAIFMTTDRGKSINESSASYKQLTNISLSGGIISGYDGHGNEKVKTVFKIKDSRKVFVWPNI